MTPFDDHAVHPVHGALVRRLGEISRSGLLLDLGAGRGDTVELATKAFPDLHVLALDRRQSALMNCRERVAGSSRVAELIADLDLPLPFQSQTADVAVSHNVLECLGNPVEALSEIRRVLKRRGRLLLSHTDFAGIIVNSIQPDLNRAVIEAHTFATPTWMSVSDGYASRKLSGYARAAGFEIRAVEPVTIVDTEFLPGGFAAHRIASMLEVIRGSGRVGGVTLGDEELEGWMKDLRALADAGAFFFSETAFILDLVSGVDATLGHD